MADRAPLAVSNRIPLARVSEEARGITALLGGWKVRLSGLVKYLNPPSGGVDINLARALDQIRLPSARPVISGDAAVDPCGPGKVAIEIPGPAAGEARRGDAF